MASEFQSFWKLTNSISTNADTADNFGYSDAPKQRFTFTVEFRFRTGLGIQGSDDMNAMDFAVKQATRPTSIVSYQDVNFYNFRTRVATKREIGTSSITFYDDNKNKAHDIYESYLKTLSPVENLDRSQADLLDTQGQGGSASIGPLTVNRHGILQNIRLTHHYNRSYTPGDTAKIHYDYLNPKITTMVLDELDMTQSEAPTVTFNFIYDGVNIVKE